MTFKNKSLLFVGVITLGTAFFAKQVLCKKSGQETKASSVATLNVNSKQFRFTGTEKEQTIAAKKLITIFEKEEKILADSIAQDINDIKDDTPAVVAYQDLMKKYGEHAQKMSLHLIDKGVFHDIYPVMGTTITKKIIVDIMQNMTGHLLPYMQKLSAAVMEKPTLEKKQKETIQKCLQEMSTLSLKKMSEALEERYDLSSVSKDEVAQFSNKKFRFVGTQKEQRKAAKKFIELSNALAQSMIEAMHKEIDAFDESKQPAVAVQQFLSNYGKRMGSIMADMIDAGINHEIYPILDQQVIKNLTVNTSQSVNTEIANLMQKISSIAMRTDVDLDAKLKQEMKDIFTEIYLVMFNNMNKEVQDYYNI